MDKFSFLSASGPGHIKHRSYQVIKHRNPPNNLLLKMMVARDRLINGQCVQSWQKNWGYFHLNINCLQRKYSFLEISDIYIPNNIRCSLQMCHIDKLKQMGWWDQMHVRHFCSRCVNPN